VKFYPPNLLFIGILSLLASGCAGIATPDSGTPGYPAQYRQALADFAGQSNVDSAVIERFVDFLADLGGPNTGENAALLYAEDLHFSDALMVTRDKEMVVDHFTRLGNAGTRVDVEIHQTLQSDKDVYLIWSMQAYFTPIRKEVTSDTLGVTHVRFDKTGRVVLHQDFWDSGLGFYSHIPVLGAGVRAVGRRFAADK